MAHGPEHHCLLSPSVSDQRSLERVVYYNGEGSLAWEIVGGAVSSLTSLPSLSPVYHSLSPQLMYQYYSTPIR